MNGRHPRRADGARRASLGQMAPTGRSSSRTISPNEVNGAFNREFSLERQNMEHRMGETPLGILDPILKDALPR